MSSDLGVRVRAAHERAGERVVAEVVEVAAVPTHEPVVLDAAIGLAEHLASSCTALLGRCSSAARSTDLTMFW